MKQGERRGRVWTVTYDEPGGLMRPIRLATARRKAQQERRATEHRFRSAPFPLYGLPGSWKGMRCLGGSGGSDRQILELSLVHGVPVEGAGPMLVVETALPSDSFGGGPLRVVAEHLWRDPTKTVTEVVTDLGRRWEPRSLNLEPLPVAGLAEVPVEGESVSFTTLSQPGRWVARGTVGHYLLRLEGLDFPLESVELVRIADVERYVRGTRAFEEGSVHW